MYRWPWAGIQTSNWPDSRGLWDTWTFSLIMNLLPLYFPTIQGGKRSLLNLWSATDSFATYTCVMDIARSRWFWFVRYLRRDCCSEVLNSSNLRSPRCTWKAFSHYINQIGAASINSKSLQWFQTLLWTWSYIWNYIRNHIFPHRLAQHHIDITIIYRTNIFHEVNW